MRHVIPISGKDSCATALVQMARAPDLPYEFFFSDVGVELPETYTWLDQVEKRFARPVVRIGKSLEQVIRGKGMLPSRTVRFCTQIAKIEPMERWLGADAATIYLGIRADEDRVGLAPTKGTLHPVYPLIETGVTLPLVYLILERADLLPPAFFWQRLYDTVLDRLQRYHNRGFGLGIPPADFLQSLPRHYFNELFSWRTRSNCFWCFFQRRYEWVGLLEHHPNLFDLAEALERECGSGDRREDGESFYWTDIPLGEIRQQAARIFARRVIQVLRTLRKKRVRRGGRLELDLLEVTSCGLFCGK